MNNDYSPSPPPLYGGGVNREVGGRILPYREGQPKFDKDPYRGLRRRPWACFRVGLRTPEFSSELFVAIVSKVHQAMVNSGILLDSEKDVLKCTCIDQDYGQLKRELEEALRTAKENYDEGPLSTPVVIFVFDGTELADEQELDEICSCFVDRIYAFKLERDEVMSSIGETDYFDLDKECNRFAEFVKNAENIVESIATQWPVDEEVNNFGKDLSAMVGVYEDIPEDAVDLGIRMHDEQDFVANEQRRRESNLRAIQMAAKNNYEKEMREKNGMPPPGLGPPGISMGTAPAIKEKFVDFPSTSSQGPPGLLTSPPGLPVVPPPPPGLERYPQGKRPSSFGAPKESPPGIDLPPGIPLERPPGIPAQQPISHNCSSVSIDISSDCTLPMSQRSLQMPQKEEEEERVEEDQQDESYYESVEEEVQDPAEMLSHADVIAAMDFLEGDVKKRGCPVPKHSSAMATVINGSRLYARLEKPFSDINHNMDLLLVINYALCTKRAHGSAKKVIRGVFRMGYPVKVRQMFLDRLFSTGGWSYNSASLLFEIFELYFNTARYRGGFMLNVNSFVPSFNELLNSFSDCNKVALCSGGKVTEDEYRRLECLIEHIGKWIRKAEDIARTAAIASPELHSLDSTLDNRSLSRMSSRPDSQVPSVNEHDDWRRREDEERRQREYEDRRMEEARKHQDEARWYEEERRRREFEQQESRRREYEEQKLRRRKYEDEESRRREQEYDHQRRAQEPLGFRNGGGTAPVVNDDEYPVIDISDSIDEEPEGPAPPQQQQKSEPNLPTIDTDKRPKQPYNYMEEFQDDYQPPYERCEKIEPPEDFKTLTEVPTLADYVNPKEPYLRRIQELGVYKNAHHYLDVQFRLLREDLVSPMRDGIDIYRKNGTCKGNRKENVPCSDISIFNIETVDGKQVTERDGLEMRILWPAQYDIMNMFDNDREMKELGLVMLSCDRFQEDFHLGHIQTSLLIQKGCLHLAVHEETRPFLPNKTYQMAQATSYLPSYKHVLKNLKMISPFKPIPFERYIVHGKKEIFRPNFQQHKKTEDQLHEEGQMLRKYNDIRSDAASKRYMAGKPIPRGMDADSYDYQMVEPKKEEQDDEYRQLREPMFRDILGVDRKDDDLIKIDRKWYKIPRLLDDFKPDNMDESQRQAFCNTFKHELSLIQGPPGTGKTHIGVQIIKTMLHNRSHWKMTEPILVVCFTNSGLDNFLERIYEMIENDDELSRDNGKPKMIRYGRKCESEYLKRRKVMRYDVHDQYRSLVSERSNRDQNQAGGNKRKVGADLVLSSYTLYCSRNDLLSYLILSRVMDPAHQTEIMQFACEHVDSKENPLNFDEAVACWLLDRDFGRVAKAQAKKAKKNKYQEMHNISDEEIDPAFLTVQDADYDDEEDDMDDEQRLDKLFERMNVGCTGKDILGMASASAGDEYYTKGTWQIAHDHRPPEVVLLGKKMKTKQSNHSVDEHINQLVKEVQKMILSTPPLPKHELEDCKYIFSLARPKRWALYVTWCDAVRSLVVEGLPKQIADYRSACEKLLRAQDVVDAEIMRMPMIIGATTTGCSRLRPILEVVEPRILIVEEAAEVLEAHILSAMISTVEHCVMIGDHKQLRPNPAVHELGTEYGMRISMFERLVERALPYSQLRQQHRMNLNISNIIVKPSFYDNVLDAENVENYPPVEGMDKNLYFWSHSKPEETPDGISWMNKHEAVMAVKLVQHLLKQNYTPQDIVVLTTYAAQRQYFYREYPMTFGQIDTSLIPVETVDSFQGRERKIAIVSLVRSHRGVQVNFGIGFLAVANRICVALTRAQHGMYVIGNGAYIKNNAALWSKIVDNLNAHHMIQYSIPLKCVAHGNVINIREPSDFAQLSPEGGCLEQCNIEKKCGHICERRCHPKVEFEHDLRCEMPCKLRCMNPQYKHPCGRMCFEDCGPCLRLESIQLQCGHTISVPCSRIPLAQCDQKCSKVLPCGHPCPLRCGVECISRQDCEQLVTLKLPDCSHSKLVKCCSLFTGEKLNLECEEQCENNMLTCEHRCKELCGRPCTIECMEIVTVQLPCGHGQEVQCSKYMPNRLDAIKCQTLVPKTLIPCGHKEKVPCGQEPSTDLCSARCPKIIKECGHMCGDRCGNCYISQQHLCQQVCQQFLRCGHQCSAKCSETCPPCKAYCTTACSHFGCGVSGSPTYGRECSALCVMCTSNCFNKCIHRSCTMKCFEECNVKVCSEPCTEKLKCGHACLGMCGEVCPKICGTCERQTYLTCVQGSSQRVHRLIQVPKCLCIVPVEQLDEHVKRQKEINVKLTCPKCKMDRPLTGILRYAKYMKKRVFEENLNKQNFRNVQQSTLESKIKSNLDDAAVELMHISTNMNDDHTSTLRSFKQHILWVSAGWDEYKGKQDQKWRLGYLREISRGFKAIGRLLAMVSKQRISSRKDIPPALDTMVLQSFGGMPFNKVFEELKRVNELMDENAKYFMLGTVMPKLRLYTFRMAAYQMVSALINKLCCMKQNIPDQAAKTIHQNCYAVLNGDERVNLTSKLAALESQVLKIVPDINAQMTRYLSWEKLDVPEF